MNGPKVLFVSSGDLIGSRFNGYDWLAGLAVRGVSGSMLVNWNHDSKRPEISNISNFWNRSITRKIRRLIHLEYLHRGIEFGKYPWSRKLLSSKRFKEADLIHLQIVHDGTLDFHTISKILEKKPTVWTWHDPWPLAGHCIYPMDCPRFKVGCGNCPDLSRPFKIGKDLTIRNRAEKRRLIEQSQTIHITTQWFENLIQKSIGVLPILKILPFGIPDEFFTKINRDESRAKLWIPSNDFVIGIRSVIEPQKNFSLFKEALRHLDRTDNITIITVQNFGQLDEFKGKFNVIELPWTNQTDEIISFYDSLDVFVMPSLYETFGMMGIEAMSRGVPVIGLANTALDEICELDKNGFISLNEPMYMSALLTKLLENRSLIEQKSEISREYVSSKFRINHFLDKLIDIYSETIKNYENK